MKKRILVYSPNPLDGVSFYRQWGPLSQLHDKLECISFPMDAASYSNWVYYLNYDVALMSRPHKYNDWHFAQECKKFGLPLWVDYDDDLFNITPDNPVYHTFASDQTRKYISDVLKLADVVTVATETNKSWVKENLGVEAMVIPNAIPNAFLKYKKEFTDNKRAAWRGSDSHREDLFAFSDEIAEVLNSHPDWETVFFGMYSKIVDEKCKRANVRWAKPVNICDFIIEFTKYNPSVVFVPLIDNQFNRVKSNLAWLDATLAGAAVVGPNWPNSGWNAGLFVYDKIKDFPKELAFLMENKQSAKNSHDASWDYIQTNLLLSSVNEMRLDLIHKLSR